jgi:hypothetical protein
MRNVVIGGLAAVLWWQMASAQFTQVGTPLVGSEARGSARQGESVALSADGTTGIIGGPNDANGVGAVWVFTRSGSKWTQQGSKLVGTSTAMGFQSQGYSVCLSADGNTALVGGPSDNQYSGAAWVFTRSGSTWTQLGDKLVGAGVIGFAVQGHSVAISGDGSTAVVGGPSDAGGAGAVWVFMRSGGGWTQQGSKLVGSGATGDARQGSSVAISGDGGTVLVGGSGDDDETGAVWVFTRSGGEWTQQGNKLVGSAAVGKSLQGSSVALSADGNTAIVGGYNDSYTVGAAWVFVRSGAVWSQQAGKLVGGDVQPPSYLGWSVALSGDGDTAVLGGPDDYYLEGAAWVFTRSGGEWRQSGSKLVGSANVGSGPTRGASVALSSDGRALLLGGPEDDRGAGATWTFAKADTPRATIYTPAMAHNPGLHGTFWKTRFEAHNRGTTQAEYTVALLRKNEENSNPATASFRLDPGRSVVYSDVLGSMFDFAGSATLRTTVMSGDVVISARTYNEQPTGTNGQLILGQPDSKATRENQEVRLVQLAYSADPSTGFRTNLGVASACSVPITVTMDLHSGDGTLLGRRAFELRPYEYKQETNSFSYATTVSVDAGYAIVLSTTPGARYFVYASVIDNRTGDPMYVPAQ